MKKNVEIGLLIAGITVVLALCATATGVIDFSTTEPTTVEVQESNAVQGIVIRDDLTIDSGTPSGE